MNLIKSQDPTRNVEGKLKMLRKASVKSILAPGVVVCTFNPSTPESEASRALEFEGSLV